MDRTVVARFWAKVNVAGPDDCWEWTASKTMKGYGQFGVYGGSPKGAHRVAWEMEVGPIPEGLFVCHHCDNPGCVNPAHLFVGSPSDNMRDCVTKGRHRSPNNMGAANGRAKLTNAQVLAIRADTRVQVAVAAEFGVCQQMVSRIRAEKSWGHLAGQLL